MRIERFEDIDAWQLARELTRKVYGLTNKAKFARDFGLKGQIQDAARMGSSLRLTLVKEWGHKEWGQVSG
jgi:hypothetical protein